MERVKNSRSLACIYIIPPEIEIEFNSQIQVSNATIEDDDEELGTMYYVELCAYIGKSSFLYIDP